MSLPQIPAVDREQAITNVIQALALQEAALASLINAEAAKIDALVAAGIPAPAAIQEVESYQAAVANVLQIVAQKQQGLGKHMELLHHLMMAPKKEMPNP